MQDIRKMFIFPINTIFKLYNLLISNYLKHKFHLKRVNQNHGVKHHFNTKKYGKGIVKKY